MTNFEKCHIWPLEGTTKGIWDLDGNHFGCIDCSYDLVLSNLSYCRGFSGVWGHFEINTGLYCTYKEVKNEVFSKVLIASFWPLLTQFGMIFDQIGHVCAQWPRNRGCRGCICTPRFQKLSHENAIKI